MIRLSDIYDYIETEKHGNGEKTFSINIENIKTIEDVKQVLKICNVNVSFKNEGLINNENKHLIRVSEYDYY